MLKHLLTLALLYTYASLCAQPPVEVELKELLSISLPYGFVDISTSEIAERYPQPHPPIAVYEDLESLSSWTFTSKASIWRPQDVKLLEQFMRAKIEALYESKVKWLEQHIYETQGQKALMMSFISRSPASSSLSSNGQQSYHSLLSFIRNNQQITLHFRCPINRYPEWVDQVAYSIKTLQIY